MVAIVTGASRGIGLEISKYFLENGYTVYGISRHIESIGFNHNSFIKINCDLTNINEMERTIKKIRKENEINVLVNNAGVGFFSYHENLKQSQIIKMNRLNFETPLLITNLLLRKLKESRGMIINISSITALNENVYGASYGATKAGLSSFSNSMFKENRKHGLKSTNIYFDITKTSFYDNLDFKNIEDEEYYIPLSDVRKSLQFIMETDAVVREIVITPQKHGILKK